MDAGYASEVLRTLEALRVALISAIRKDADQCAQTVEVLVRTYLTTPPRLSAGG